MPLVDTAQIRAGGRDADRATAEAIEVINRVLSGLVDENGTLRVDNAIIGKLGALARADFGDNVVLQAGQRVLLDGADGTTYIEKASGSNVVRIIVNDEQIAVFNANAVQTGRALELTAFDNGAGIGRRVIVRRNNDGVTPAAGCIALEDKSGTLYYLWPDDSGVLRINTTAPTNANDTAGTVVGTQT